MKILISRLKEDYETSIKKENFKPEIKPMIENLQDELYQIENKQAKGAKLRANIRWELAGKNFFQSTWKTESEKSNKIWIID